MADREWAAIQSKADIEVVDAVCWQRPVDALSPDFRSTKGGAVLGIQPTISDLLERHKPDGTQYIVFISDDTLPAAYGPWDSFAEAYQWSNSNGGIVVPLYARIE